MHVVEIILELLRFGKLRIVAKFFSMVYSNSFIYFLIYLLTLAPIIPTSHIFLALSLLNSSFLDQLFFLHCSWVNLPSPGVPLLPSLPELQAHLTRLPQALSPWCTPSGSPRELWSLASQCPDDIRPDTELGISKFLLQLFTHASVSPSLLRLPRGLRWLVNLLVFLTSPLSSTASHRYWGAVPKSFNE